MNIIPRLGVLPTATVAWTMDRQVERDLPAKWEALLAKIINSQLVSSQPFMLMPAVGLKPTTVKCLT